MSNVRNYLKKKEQQQDVNYRKKIRKHRLQIFYRTVLVLLLGGAAVALIYEQIKNRVYTEYEIVSSIDKTDSAEATYLKYNKYILSYSKDGASAIDENGKQLWNQTYEMQNPMVDICDEYVAIGDYKGSRIYVMDLSGKKTEIDTMLPIQEFTVSSDGVVAVVLEDSATTWIRLYNPSGEKVTDMKTTMRKSGYPITISLSPDSTKLGVSYLYMDSGQITSMVAFYNFGEVGKNEQDNFVSGANYENSVVPVLNFMDNATAFAVGDSRIMIYKGNQKPVSSFEQILEEDVQSIFYGDKYIGIIRNNIEGNTRYSMDVYDTNGTIVLKINFDTEYKDVIFHKEEIIIYNGTECVIYNMKGEEKYSGSFGDGMIALIPMDAANKFIVLDSEHVKVVKLR